jgi:hypothetical protein
MTPIHPTALAGRAGDRSARQRASGTMPAPRARELRPHAARPARATRTETIS